MVHFTKCPRTGNCWCEAQRYSAVLALTLAILAGEVLGAQLSGSLALMADAVHVLMDGGAIFVSIAIAVFLRTRHAHEATIRARGAKIQASLLAIAAVWIALEAVERLQNPVEIKSITMIVVALLGTAGNYLQHRMLEGGEHRGNRNVNHRALDCHILSDLAQSIAVVVGGIVIALWGACWVDTLLSLGVAVVMICWAVAIFRDSGKGGQCCHHHH